MKLEAHKLSKLTTKRYRLISQMSLEDQVVDRFLFLDLVERQLRDPHRSVKIGWSPVPQGYQVLQHAFPADVRNTDATAFDWTLPSWVVPEITSWIIEQAREPSEQWKRAVTARIQEVLGAGTLVRLPDGTQYRQSRPGVMKSGWLLTILINSLVQIGLHSLAFYRAFGTLFDGVIWTMGDDVLMSWLSGLSEERFVEALQSLGLRIKRIGPEREFAGFRFEDAPIPVYSDKHRWLLNHEGPEERILAYHLLYGLAPRSDLTDYLRRESPLDDNVVQCWYAGLIRSPVCVTPELASWM